jgi:hypothetical protein
MQKNGRCLTIFTFFSLKNLTILSKKKKKKNPALMLDAMMSNPQLLVQKQQLYYVPCEEPD